VEEITVVEQVSLVLVATNRANNNTSVAETIYRSEEHETVELFVFMVVGGLLFLRSWYDYDSRITAQNTVLDTSEITSAP